MLYPFKHIPKSTSFLLLDFAMLRRAFRRTLPSFQICLANCRAAPVDSVSQLQTKAFELNQPKRLLFTTPEIKLEPDQEVLTPANLSNGVLPFVSRKSLLHHYQLAFQATKRLNLLTEGTSYEQMSLEDILELTSSMKNDAVVYNYAADVWNHNFFFAALKNAETNPSPVPSRSFAEVIETHFSSFEYFQTLFEYNARALFGSGWTWLVSMDGNLEILNTSNSGTPAAVGRDVKPLLCLDMWEHSFMPDYGHNKQAYVKNFFANVDWSIVENRYRDTEVEELEEEEAY